MGDLDDYYDKKYTIPGAKPNLDLDKYYTAKYSNTEIDKSIAIDKYIQQAADPQLERAKISSAMYLADQLKVSQKYAFENYDALAQSYWGRLPDGRTDFQAIQDVYTATKLSTDATPLIWEYMKTGGNNPELEKQITDIYSKIPPGDSFTRGLPTEMAKAVASLLSTAVYTAGKGLEGFAKGATGGAALALLAGTFSPLIAVPEELVTVPALGAIMGSASAGGMAVAAAAELEAASAYMSMRQAGIPHNIAIEPSMWVGAVNGASELVGIGAGIKLLGGKQVLAGILNTAIVKTISKGTVANIAKEFVKTTGGKLALEIVGTTLVQTGQEIIQQMSTIIGQEVASGIAETSGYKIDRKTANDIASELMDVAWTSFLAMGVSSIASGGVRIGAKALGKKILGADGVEQSVTNEATAGQGATQSAYTENGTALPTALADDIADIVSELKGKELVAIHTTEQTADGELGVATAINPKDTANPTKIKYTMDDNGGIHVLKVEGSETGVRFLLSELGVDETTGMVTFAEDAYKHLNKKPATSFETTLSPLTVEKFTQQYSEAAPLVEAGAFQTVLKLIDMQAKSEGLLGKNAENYIAENFAGIQALSDIEYEQIKAKRVEAGMEPDFRGFSKRLADGRTMISLAKNADITTIHHEVFHVFVSNIGGEARTLLGKAYKKNVADWTRVEHEKAAQDWEKYLKTGIAPTAEAQTIFDKIKEWFTEFYGTLSPIWGEDITPQARKAFDRMLTPKTPNMGEAQNVAWARAPIPGAEMYFQDEDGLLAPNGKPSNLNARQYAQVRTPEFKAWFGDWENDPENASKVVDENGEPLVVYHGTEQGEFDTFLKEKARDTGQYGKGFYFTENKEIAKGYGKNDEYGRVMAVFLNGRYGIAEKRADRLAGKKIDRETDYIHPKDRDGNSDRGIWFVKEPNQIKSATANNGEFSTENDSILFQGEKAKLENKVIKEFGLTDEYLDAGFLLSDGRMVDLKKSTKREWIRHGEIANVLDLGGDDAYNVDYFMKKTGAMRIDIIMGAYETRRPITKAQADEMEIGILFRKNPDKEINIAFGETNKDLVTRIEPTSEAIREASKKYFKDENISITDIFFQPSYSEKTAFTDNEKDTLINTTEERIGKLQEDVNYEKQKMIADPQDTGHAQAMADHFQKIIEVYRVVSDALLNGTRKFENEYGTKVALIHPATRGTKYQISYFDRFGAYGDNRLDTASEILDKLVGGQMEVMFSIPMEDKRQLGDILFQPDIKDSFRTILLAQAKAQTDVQVFIADAVTSEDFEYYSNEVTEKHRDPEEVRLEIELPYRNIWEEAHKDDAKKKEMKKWGQGELEEEAKQFDNYKDWEAWLVRFELEIDEIQSMEMWEEVHPEAVAKRAEELKAKAEDIWAKVHLTKAENRVRANQLFYGALTKESVAEILIKASRTPGVHLSYALRAAAIRATNLPLEEAFHEGKGTYDEYGIEKTGNYWNLVKGNIKKNIVAFRRMALQVAGDKEGLAFLEQELGVPLSIEDRTNIGMQILDSEMLREEIITGKITEKELVDEIKHGDQVIKALNGAIVKTEKDRDEYLKYGSEAEKALEDTTKKKEKLEKMIEEVKTKFATQNALRKLKDKIAKFKELIFVPSGLSIDFEFTEIVNEIQAAVSVDGYSQDNVLEKLKKYYEQNALAGTGDPSTYKKIQAIVRKPMKASKAGVAKEGFPGWTIDEYQTIYEEIKKLKGIGRVIQQAKWIANTARHKKAMSLMASRLVLKGQPPEDVALGSIGREKTAGIAAKSVLNKLKIGLLHANRWLDFMDGGKASYNGPWHEYFYNEEQKAKQRVIANTNKRVAAGVKAIKEAGLSLAYFAKQATVEGETYTRGQLLGMWMMLKNERSAAAVIHGNKTPVKILASIDKIVTDKEKVVGKYIMKELEGAYGRQREAFIKLFNRDPGTELNYTQIVREEVSSVALEQNKASLMADKLHIGKGKVQRNFLEERIDIADEHQTAVKLDQISIYFDGIEAQEHFVESSQAVRDMRSYIMNRDLRKLISRTVGKEFIKGLKEWVDEFANPHIYQVVEPTELIAGAIRRNMVTAGLGYNVLSALKQTIGVIVSIPETGALEMLGSLGRFSFQHKAMVEFAYENDPMIGDNSYERDLKIMKGLIRSNPIATGIKTGVNAGMEPLRILDRWTKAIVFNAAFARFKKNNLSDTKAIMEAHNVVARTQPMGDWGNLPGISKGSGEMMKFATMFTTALNQMYNQVTYDMPRRKKGFIGFAVATLMAQTLTAYLMFSIGKGRLPEDWEDMISALQDQGISIIPVLGTVINGARSGWYAPASPLQVPYDLANIVNSKQPLEKKAAQLVSLMVDAFGLPGVEARRIKSVIDTGDARDILGSRWGDSKNE